MSIKKFNNYLNEDVDNSDSLEIKELKKYLNEINSVFTYDWLNKQSEGNLYRAAIYQNLHLVDLINRKYDGRLMHEDEHDEEGLNMLKEMFDKSKKFTVELEDFFVKIKIKNKK